MCLDFSKIKETLETQCNNCGRSKIHEFYVPEGAFWVLTNQFEEDLRFPLIGLVVLNRATNNYGYAVRDG